MFVSVDDSMTVMALDSDLQINDVRYISFILHSLHNTVFLFYLGDSTKLCPLFSKCDQTDKDIQSVPGHASIFQEKMGEPPFEQHRTLIYYKTRTGLLC